MNWRLLAAALLVLLLAAAAADSFRPAPEQVTAAVYGQAIGWYKAGASPILHRWVRCRFTPTCSTYSLEAVRRFGIREGLWLTAKRLRRCTAATPPGTVDPVPAAP